MGALSSRFHSCSSLETPLISPLPPLPSYDSVDRYHDGSKRRARGRSWVAGDDFRGQSVINRFTRESRFGTESGIQQAPTIPSLPNVDVNEDTEGKRWQNSRYAQPCEYCTKQQHPEEYAGKPYESKFQQPHYRRQDKPKMRHLNQEERDIQHHTPSGRTAEGEALPWGRGWRVPDPYRAMPRSGSFKPLPISATGLGLQ
ncbi:hypothetical protein QQS21_004112 [Conoideocrella luteorostrata]|uniref:Uncharacterized protein n=1 Tax=Conoideocrella luteorostrata TaxID=1105319 RepID=A0AAJ0CUL5_9HYPO|nr:hypothetical protein QQS21_004112 [Conoideocrella luteorostrata]